MHGDVVEGDARGGARTEPRVDAGSGADEPCGALDHHVFAVDDLGGDVRRIGNEADDTRDTEDRSDVVISAEPAVGRRLRAEHHAQVEAVPEALGRFRRVRTCAPENEGPSAAAGRGALAPSTRIAAVGCASMSKDGFDRMRRGGGLSGATAGS